MIPYWFTPLGKCEPSPSKWITGAADEVMMKSRKDMDVSGFLDRLIGFDIYYQQDKLTGKSSYKY